MGSLIIKLINKYPTAYILVLTPIHRTLKNNYVNEFGIRNVRTLADYVRAEKEVCEKNTQSLCSTFIPQAVYALISP